MPCSTYVQEARYNTTEWLVPAAARQGAMVLVRSSHLCDDSFIHSFIVTRQIHINCPPATPISVQGVTHMNCDGEWWPAGRNLGKKQGEEDKGGAGLSSISIHPSIPSVAQLDRKPGAGSTIIVHPPALAGQLKYTSRMHACMVVVVVASMDKPTCQQPRRLH